MKLAQQQPQKPPLEDRIAEIHAEIEAFINDVIEKNAGPGNPAAVLRHNLMTRASWCQCSAYTLARKPL